MLKKYLKSFSRTILFVIALTCFSGATGFVLIKTININADIINTDNLGNLYMLRGNTFYKYTSKGSHIAEYTDKSINSFSSFDVSDPFKIQLFSKTTASIIYLDNQLNLQGNTTNLFNSGIFSPTVACASYDNGSWIWDNTTNELIRINHNGAIVLRSENLNNIVAPNPQFSMLYEKDFTLYACSPEHGVFLFDRYGALLKRIPLHGIKNFRIYAGKIIFFKDDHLKSFDLKSLEQSKFKLPLDSAANATFHDKYLYVQHKDSVTIYSTNRTL